jgi:anionic cell wall polymer biosynthesis LytR-Cps2A-Psr (LCP) family protein
MVRQQAVLRAIRNQIQPCSLVPQIPTLLATLGQTFWTDMSLDDVRALLALAEHIRVGNIRGYELTPDATGAVDEYLTAASLSTIRGIVANGLDGVSAGISDGGEGGGPSC